MDPDIPHVTDLSFLAVTLGGTTLTAAEAIRFAQAWWDKTGRHVINRDFNRSRYGERFRPAGANGAPAIKTTGERVIELPSGILNGVTWAELSRSEQLRVTKGWLQHHGVEEYPCGPAT